MNYQAHYDRLIARARNRELTGYSERHHVLPRCLGGSDSKSNLVNLTAAEHYVAHQLLVKIYPGNRSIAYAAYVMAVTSKNHEGRANKHYGWLKGRFSEAHRARVVTEETRRKISLANTGKRHTGRKMSDETKAKLRAARLGKSLSPEHRAKISAGGKGKKLNETQKKALDAARRQKHSPTRIANMKAGQRAARLRLNNQQELK